MNIGGKLKALRDAFSLTLTDVAEKTGIGVSSLSEFENNKREPMLSNLKRLAELYERPLTYFLEATIATEPALLWRERPNKARAAQLEAKFLKLCRQYKNLEAWTKSPTVTEFKRFFIETYPKDYKEVRKLAYEVCDRLKLGSRPGESLFRVLEEVYAVKIFHLDIENDGSSACIYTDEYGPAIMLNKSHVQWRRNFDLAHEVFHLITWTARGTVSPDVLTEKDEKYANYFASVLLMPEEQLKEAIESHFTEKREITFTNLDAIARQFGVSLDALFWRIYYVYGIPKEKIQKWITASHALNSGKMRCSPNPVDLPERYKNLALAALSEGVISSRQFANYLEINPATVYGYQKLGKLDGIKIQTGSF